jgi:hypothetical protein
MGDMSACFLGFERLCLTVKNCDLMAHYFCIEYGPILPVSQIKTHPETSPLQVLINM